MNLLKTSLLVVVLGFSTLTVAQAAALSDAQRAHIDRYLADHGLNQYGDRQGTMYLGGNPLFDEATGRTTDRYEHVLRKLPRILEGFVTTLPWNGVEAELAKSARIDNDFDPRRQMDRVIDEAIKAEEQGNKLVETIRTALDARDFRAIEAALNQLAGLSAQELFPYSSVLRDARRMLRAEVLQEPELMNKVIELIKLLDTLDSK